MATELAPLENFYEAEGYHQDYLKKNPGGYCHISFESLNEIRTVQQEAAAQYAKLQLRNRTQIAVMYYRG